MAKEVESTNEPSQSSSSLPPLAENEVELVIDRFWRDTRPRACVRSETKMVNGFNFRLLVWPQGSKQSQSHLSAFVEVVPSVVQEKKKDEEESSSSSTGNRPYPPDWACPCVFYRISVMNFKQKYPYSKADTWTFSYVCPDRGWHTLLDTRYINRRDGYLSSEGSLVIRAVAYPRFAHPVPVLPLLANVTHISPLMIDSSSQSSSIHRPGLGNFLATDHVNALLQSLYHLPGFRRFIYCLVRPGVNWKQEPTLTAIEMETIEQGLESCAETVKEIMNRLSAAAPEMSTMIQSEFIKDCRSGGFCVCNRRPACVSKLERLRQTYGRCQVLISCLEESLFTVSQSLFGRKQYRLDQATMKRTQFDAYRQIVKDCKRILSTVANPLFFIQAESQPGNRNLIEELQLLFARMELGASAASSGLLDTRGVLRELGLASGGLLSSASPDGLFTVFYEALIKAISNSNMISTDSSNNDAAETVRNIFTTSYREAGGSAEETAVTHIRLADAKPTSVEKHISAWLNEEGGGTILSPGKILTLQLRNKIKDRLDVSERIKIKGGSKCDEENILDRHVSSDMRWDAFLDHTCCVTGEDFFTEGEESSCVEGVSYKLHAVQMYWGSEMASAHYSAVVRNHRLGGWTKYDDGWNEELVDLGSCSGGPDWVFSPEWACSSLIYVREDSIDSLYDRSVDVRCLRPDIFSLVAAASAGEDGCVDKAKCAVLCNRSLPHATPRLPSVDFDPACQVEVCLITEKDVISACPGGFSIPFNFSISDSGARKLIVRKDIQVDRLMQAVAEHFKIPLQLQKLFALRYYPETAQERFELMQSSRLVSLYLDAPKPVIGGGSTKTASSKPTLGGGYQGSSSHQLYVFVSASRGDATVWIKVHSERDMGMVSLCSLSVDTSKPLRDYFETIATKSGSSVNQFVVFEEVAPRVVELRRTSVPIKAEKIMNGDILVFVPLTDNAKRALIGTASAACIASGGHKYPKRRLSGAEETAADEELLNEDQMGDEEETSCNLNDRCKRFLSRVRDEMLDDQFEDLLMDDSSEDGECREECCGCKEATRLNARIELVRRYLRHRPDDQIKLFDGMTRDELDRLMTGGKRRLDIPASLRDELSQHPITHRCFYCQLPLTAAAGSDQTCKVSCTSSCVKGPVNYHDTCVKELVLENSGSHGCIITEGCRGKIVLDSKTILEPPRMSQAALRSKLTSVLSTPQVPEIGKNGKIVLNGKPVQTGGSAVPQLPSGLKGAKKASLPVEALWWNACLTAFGGFDNLHAAVVDKHWDSADLAQAKNIFVSWCQQLLEKQLMKTKKAVKITPKPVVLPSRERSVSSVSSSSDSSSDEEAEPSRPIQEKDTSSVELAKILTQRSDSEGDSDDGFVVASRRNGRRSNKVAAPETPTTRVPTPTAPTVVIPSGFFGDCLSPKKESIVEPDEAAAEEAAASIAQQAVNSLLSLDRVDDVLPSSTGGAQISLVDSLILGPSEVETPSPSLLESRLSLLPLQVRQFCLPVDLVFVYYSAQFFGVSNQEANTVSLTPPRDSEMLLDTIQIVAKNVRRVFTSPHQTFPDSPITVQWFVEFNSAQDCKKFSDFVASSCPEWGPETGALLPAGMLGFAV